MFELFTTREIVTLIYIIFFFGVVTFLIATEKNIRNAFFDFVKTACSPQILIFFILLVLYAFFIILVISHFPFWRWFYLKDIIIWGLFVGVPICFHSVSWNLEEHYFRKVVSNNLKLSVFIDFFLNTFTFGIIAEFVLQGIIIFLSLLQAISSTEEKYASAKKLFDALLAIIGFAVFFQTIRVAIYTYPNYDIEEWIITILIPLVLSILYIPMAYLMALYSRYQLLFLHLRFKDSSNKWASLQYKYKVKVIFMCGLSLYNIVLFRNCYTRHMLDPISEKEFDTIVNEFKASRKQKQNRSL